MNGYGFTCGAAALVARADGALWWPARRLLAVSDLHFGKAERIARRGGSLLPPYETAETLDRLAAAIDATAPAMVICLGDSFDDLAAGAALAAPERQRLTGLMAGRDWVWIEGNHDPGPLDLGGTHRAELVLDGLTFRHIAAETPDGAPPAAEATAKAATETGHGRAEISGHYHPKARLAGRSHPCFVIGAGRVILPAFGCYTGGLSASAPVLSRLAGAGALAVLTGAVARAVPLDPGSSQPRARTSGR